jgi:hypothetical protein
LSVLVAIAGDVISLEMTPRGGNEQTGSVICVIMRVNGAIIYTVNLPYHAINTTQLLPYITVLPGMTVSMFEILTPSPLFTWSSVASPGPEVQLTELDTCVKYLSTSTQQEGDAPPAAGVVEYLGSAVFTSGRHRWTVLLENLSTAPSHMFVGVQCPSYDALPSPLPVVAAPSNSAAGGTRVPAGDGASSSNHGNTSSAAADRPKWGIWVKLAGGNSPAGQTTQCWVLCKQPRWRVHATQQGLHVVH